jgi:hypothetical protein
MGRLGRKVRRRQPLWWNLTRFERGERRDNAEKGTDDWAAGVIEQGRTPRQEVSVSIEAAPADVAKRLGIPADTLAVRRHRVRARRRNCSCQVALRSASTPGSGTARTTSLSALW